MKRDALTLALFPDAALPTPTARIPPGLMTDTQTENFAWWCRNGNSDYCAAFLRNAHGIKGAEAHAIVEAFRLPTPPVAMFFDSPPCAHFNRSFHLPTEIQHEA